MIHVGYNRPFAPAVRDLEREMEALEGPTFVTCIVKGHRLGRAHWYNWPNQGTRIAGNVMHWIDLGYRLTGRRRPLWVDVTVPREEGPSVWDARALAVGFDDGSLLSVVFSAAGDETFGVQEYIDVKRQGLSAAIDNYRTLELVREGRRRRRRYGRDKGHDGEIAAMVRKALERKGDEHTVADMVATSCILFAARDAMAAGGGRQHVVLEAFP